MKQPTDSEGAAMNDVLPSPVTVEVAGGSVPPNERGYADEVVQSLCRRAGSARGRVVLAVRTNADGSTTTSADAILVLDEYRLLCAGAAATTMKEAIEALDARLQRQVSGLREHQHALGQLIWRGDGTARRRRLRHEPVAS
jgi:ribosome-associated translation inhibitor RaiA